MSIRFYMDENVQSAIKLALRKVGVDVLTAIEDVHNATPDPIVFDRATSLGRVMVSTDADMLREAHARQRSRQEFSGLVFWQQQSLSLGRIIEDLELLSRAGTPADVQNQVLFLPL